MKNSSDDYRIKPDESFLESGNIKKSDSYSYKTYPMTIHDYDPVQNPIAADVLNVVLDKELNLKNPPFFPSGCLWQKGEEARRAEGDDQLSVD